MNNEQSVQVKMTSSYYFSEYLVSAIPDITNNGALMLTGVMHQQDTYTNEKFTVYLFYAYNIAYGNNYTLIKTNVNGTMYIYYISI